MKTESEQGLEDLSNVTFIRPAEYVSSYELVERSKFVLIYNSSIGLEASILGKPVLTAGKVRYHTQRCQTVYLPGSIEDYVKQLEEWLKAEQIQTPPAWQPNARRFLYYQVFRASLPFDHYIEPAGGPGFVGLTDFPLEDLLPENSPTLKIVLEGIRNNKPFLIDDQGSKVKVYPLEQTNLDSLPSSLD
jgi:hypothetical protein